MNSTAKIEFVGFDKKIYDGKKNVPHGVSEKSAVLSQASYQILLDLLTKSQRAELLDLARSGEYVAHFVNVSEMDF